MDTQNTEKPLDSGEGLDDLLQESETSRKIKRNMQVRVAGFVLLLTALVFMVLWQKGTLPHVFQTIAYVLGGLGFIAYLSARLSSVQKTFRPRRR